ncbi:flagellar hook-basal body complex protein [Devosia sp. 2618]|uniref:flagellar hook protein FlgE n=1 Tax=Devosia sp. 2618 TaxID=3156454 RepID=UPI003392955B
MGIYGALSTAVTGLRAQSHALENISGNIANSQTTGYKRIETSFVDLIPDAPLKGQVPGAVLAQSRGTNNLQGDIQTSGTETFIALNSSGFFVVEPKVGQSDGNAVFAGSNFYTRRGDFEIDKDGMLVNGAGFYLKGLPIDPATGNVSGSVPEVLKLTNSYLAAKQTQVINYQANLPQLPKTAAYDSTVDNSEIMKAGDFAGGTTGSALAVIQGGDKELFEKNSIYGGAITVYAANGAPANVQMRWAKVDNSASGGADTWHLYYNSNSTATGTQPAWTRVPEEYTFDSQGSMDPPVAQATISNLTVNGVNVGNITIRHNTNGMKQFADVNGTASVTTLNQNGYGAGEFQSVAISDTGRVVATYSNGERIDMAQVVTAQFNGVNSLKRHDGGVFTATTESGEPIMDLTGSGILGGALEASNTDISDEFTKLIITQQAYSAGTRIVSTADEMMQEALNMVR